MDRGNGNEVTGCSFEDSIHDKQAQQKIQPARVEQASFGGLTLLALAPEPCENGNGNCSNSNGNHGKEGTLFHAPIIANILCEVHEDFKLVVMLQ
jgi:hypothetical protein